MKFVLYFPMNILIDVHLKKEFDLAASFSSLGFDSVIVVGRANLKNTYNSQESHTMRLIETGYVRRGTFFNPISFLFEVFRATRILLMNKAELVMVIHAWVIAPIVIFNYRIASLIGRLTNGKAARTVFVLWMDSDGILFKDGPNRVFWRLVLLLNMFAFDKIAIQTSCGAERLKTVFRGVITRKLHVIPSGYSSRIYRMSEPLQTQRSPIILTVARVVRVKGIDTLIRAFSQIHQKYTSWKVHVVGPIEDNDYFQELVRLTKHFQIQDKVVFLGKVSEAQLHDEYLSSSIFCLPSRAEGFPAARLEAAVHGLPVITTYAGCGEDLAKYGAVAGPIDDVSWLSNTLEELMSDAKLREASATKLQKHILSWDDVATRLLQVSKESN